MRTSELLKDCKIKLKISSDYALAKELGINSGRISDYMSGKRTPNAYAAVKIAECLGLDPLALIAEFEELTAKNATERGFWADFRARAKLPLKGFIMALLCIVTLWTGLDLTKNHGGVFRRSKHA
jgi:transcriptional regulator with XRE-family HTH domain